MTEWLKRLLQFLAAAMLLAIVLIVLSNVVCRYFLHIGLGWTEEAARFLLIAMTFVAAAAKSRSSRNMKTLTRASRNGGLYIETLTVERNGAYRA